MPTSSRDEAKQGHGDADLVGGHGSSGGGAIGEKGDR